MEIPDVSRLFKNHHIFAIEETKGEIHLKEFCCFNSNRKNSNSGRVCIEVHESLVAGVSRVKVESTQDIVVVKLKASFFKLDKDTNLINVYNSPTNGSYKNE